jgi:hypothetical protein
LFLLAAGIMAGPASARAEHVVNVMGLVNLADYRAALLVITDSPPEASFVMSTHKWVTEGQGFDDLYLKDKRLRIEIRQIDFTNGVVRAKENGVDTLYVPQPTNLVEAAAVKNLLLDHASFDDALDLYAGIKGRTLLVHPDVGRPPLTVSADATNRAEAVGIMKRALQQRGAVIVADGDKFEWIIPAGVTNIVSPAAMPARLPPKGQSPTNSVDTLPTGSINFINVPLPQALEVYQALTAQKWVQDKPLPSATITFHSQTPLTKTETLHAFDVLLDWHGLKIVNVDDKSFKLVPVAADE